MDELTGTATNARREQHMAPWEQPTPMQIAAFIGGPANSVVTLLPFGEREIAIMDPGSLYGSGKYVRGPTERATGKPMLRTGDNYPVWEWIPAEDL